MTIYEDTLFMCADCKAKSGNGQSINVRYSNTGGWSPQWEGRLCVHLSATQVLAYLLGERKMTGRGCGEGEIT